MFIDKNYEMFPAVRVLKNKKDFWALNWNKLGLSWAKLSLSWRLELGVVDEVGS